MALISVSVLTLVFGLAGPSLAGGKKSICHIPPGNPANFKIISVSENAVAAHLAHGDHVVGPEVCDNVDNDCDGSTDEDVTQATTCGVGACTGTTGFETCTAGVFGNDTCDPLAGATGETCDNVDNDCNGVVDNDPTDLGACSAGIGACLAAGNESCVAGAIQCDAVAGTPTDEVCDGLDNNCDDVVDNQAAADADCSDQEGITCTVDTCEAGVCTHTTDDSACGPGATCSEVDGCVVACPCDGIQSTNVVWDNTFNATGGACTFDVSHPLNASLIQSTLFASPIDPINGTFLIVNEFLGGLGSCGVQQGNCNIFTTPICNIFPQGLTPSQVAACKTSIAAIAAEDGVTCQTP